MLSADTTKRVLAAILHSLPDEGPGLLAKLEIRHGWGDVVHVRLSLGPTTRELPAHLRLAVESALGDLRHRVEVEWEPADA